MESGATFFSPAFFIRILIYLLYASVGLFAYFRVVPQLAKTPRRLAKLALGAQVLVIAVSLHIQPASSFEDWLWRLNWKYNIPNTLASMQLALVGAVALVAAAYAKPRPRPYRIYLIAIGAFFLVLGRDEYFDIHETHPIFDITYIAVGAAIAVATLASAWHSPRRRRFWQACLLTGMGIYFSSAFLMDKLIPRCIRLDSIWPGDCLRFAYLEESMEIIGVWLILLALLDHYSKLSPYPSRWVGRALYALPAIWFLALALMGGIRPITGQVPAQSASTAFDSGDYLHAYRIEGGRTAVYAHLYLSPRSWHHDGLGYSAHLVDQVTGESLASSNAVANLRLDFLLAPGYRPVFREWTSVIVPPAAPRNRALWILLSLWREQDGDFVNHKILGSGLETLGETQAVLGEIVLPAPPLAAPPAAIATFAGGFALDAFEMPDRARAGDTLDISFVWRSESDANEKFVQFLHLRHQETGNWWVYDQAPLGARLPTRLWYSGLADSELWNVPLPAALAVGKYEVYTGLYRALDNARLPASDANGSPLTDDRVRLGALTIESAQP